MLQEGFGARLSICTDQWYCLDEPGRSTDYGEHVSEAIALWQGSQYVQVDVGEPFIRYRDLTDWHVDLFPRLDCLTEVAAPLEVLDIRRLSWPIVFRGCSLQEGFLATMVYGVESLQNLDP